MKCEVNELRRSGRLSSIVVTPPSLESRTSCGPAVGNSIGVGAAGVALVNGDAHFWSAIAAIARKLNRGSIMRHGCAQG